VRDVDRRRLEPVPALDEVVRLRLLDRHPLVEVDRPRELRAAAEVRVRRRAVRRAEPVAAVAVEIDLLVVRLDHDLDVELRREPARGVPALDADDDVVDRRRERDRHPDHRRESHQEHEPPRPPVPADHALK
jgi:hypothetical protein